MNHVFEKIIEQINEPNLPVIIEENNQVNGEVFVFLGMGTEGNGTSTTMVELAKRLSQGLEQANVDKKILIIDFNLAEPEVEDIIFDYKKKSNLNLDQVYNQANAGKISGRDIVSNTTLIKGTQNLYIITGTKLSFLADYFDVEVMRALIQAARQEYEYIFIDTSAHFDNAATVAAIIEADIITCLTDFNGAGLRVFNYLKNSVLDTHPEIISKFKILGIERQDKKIPPEVIEEVLDFDMEGIIKHHEDEEYLKSLDEFLESLELEYPMGEENFHKKKGLLSKFKLRLNFKKNKTKRKKKLKKIKGGGY